MVPSGDAIHTIICRWISAGVLYLETLFFSWEDLRDGRGDEGSPAAGRGEGGGDQAADCQAGYREQGQL